MIESGRQGRAPIAEAMRAYARDGALAFHTPGHKQGLGAHPLLRELVTAEGLREEVSLMEELDDLHSPSGCIMEAEDLAAELFGADRAWFMVNGTTGAVHTMLVAALSPGDTVLVPRNAHRSMLGGIILAGAVPVFLQPAIDEEFGIPMALPVETVEKAMDEHPEARALALVSPTYYGIASDLAALADLLHSRDMLLLVDEAHGAHLCFGDRLPASAMESGADLAAQSTHKLLGALTQASMLLSRGGRVDPARVQRAASLLQTTSPNMLLLASLDIARLQMAEEGAERIERAVGLSEGLRRAIGELPGLSCLTPAHVVPPRAAGFDPTKLTVSVRGLGMSGMEAESILRHRCKIQCELSDPGNLLFIISMADTEQEAARLLEGLTHLSGQCRGGGTTLPMPPPFPTARQRIPPREAFWAQAETVPLEEAAGMVSAEQISFYPPGIPVLCPGEEVSGEMIRCIRATQAMGSRITGAADPALKTIRVINSVRDGGTTPLHEN